MKDALIKPLSLGGKDTFILDGTSARAIMDGKTVLFHDFDLGMPVREPAQVDPRLIMALPDDAKLSKVTSNRLVFTLTNGKVEIPWRDPEIDVTEPRVPADTIDITDCVAAILRCNALPRAGFDGRSSPVHILSDGVHTFSGVTGESGLVVMMDTAVPEGAVVSIPDSAMLLVRLASGGGELAANDQNLYWVSDTATAKASLDTGISGLTTWKAIRALVASSVPDVSPSEIAGALAILGTFTEEKATGRKRYKQVSFKPANGSATLSSAEAEIAANIPLEREIVIDISRLAPGEIVGFGEAQPPEGSRSPLPMVIARYSDDSVLWVAQMYSARPAEATAEAAADETTEPDDWASDDEIDWLDT